MTLPQYPKTRGLTFAVGERLTTDTIVEALEAGCVVDEMTLDGARKLGAYRIERALETMSPGDTDWSPAVSKLTNVRDWPGRGHKFVVSQVPQQPDPPSELSGPDALAVVMREPCEWEARFTEASGWLPFDLSIESSWHRWNAVTLQYCTFRRRQPDPFAGLELPEGLSVDPPMDGGPAYVKGDSFGIPVSATDVDRFRVCLAVAERLADLEGKDK